VRGSFDLLPRDQASSTQVPNGTPLPKEELVKDQVHIRNAEAAQLARLLARQTGKTISEVVLDALRHYRPRPQAAERGARVERWRRLLRRDHARLTRPEMPIESLYNKDTGLPE
jgi:hypothetical protein